MNIRSIIARRAAQAAASPFVTGALAIVRVLGGWRATAWFAGLLWFAWQAHSWQSLAHDLQDRADKQAAAAEHARAELAIARATVTERVVTQYVDRIKVVQGRTRTIVKEVPVYVPSDLPALPGSFRVFHDAAAAGQLPDASRIADAAPVAPAVVAETVADNYGACHEVAAQLTALQDWIRQQQAVPVK